jgi:hypothetical protein
MAETKKSLDIIGHDGKPIKNTLTSLGNKGKIAIVFPGIGYTCQMPLLYYATVALLGKGYDVLWVEYDYKNERFSTSRAREKVEWMNFDADESYKTAISTGRYKHVVLVGKSLGTFALVRLNTRINDIEKSIWLTPLLKKPSAVGIDVYNKIKGVCKNGLFIIGTEDPHYDKTKIRALEALGAKSLSILGADHSLEIESTSNGSNEIEISPLKSLKALEQVVKEIEGFV